MKMDFERVREILKEIPLRISITDYCNLNCFFCSNEGMDASLKNNSKADLKNLLSLLKLLKKHGLEHVSITGGDPTCYPQLKELLDEINKLNFKKTFFHTNGVSLNKDLIRGELKHFSKIAISIHSLDFEEWRKMTGGKKSQFEQIINNLKLLSGEDYQDKIEIKIVPIKGINCSKESIRKILDFCEENKFKFKFLIFEPIKKDHLPLVISLKEMSYLLENLGAKKLPQEKSFRNQKNYLPINKYQYKSCQGVLIEIGCGKKEVCKSCSSSNEIFITPSLGIKPCHTNPYTIDLKEKISNNEGEKIINSILRSRCFLKTSPGKNKKYWSQG